MKPRVLLLVIRHHLEDAMEAQGAEITGGGTYLRTPEADFNFTFEGKSYSVVVTPDETDDDDVEQLRDNITIPPEAHEAAALASRDIEKHLRAFAEKFHIVSAEQLKGFAERWGLSANIKAHLNEIATRCRIDTYDDLVDTLYEAIEMAKTDERYDDSIEKLAVAMAVIVFRDKQTT
jgi:hypothetical protein